MRPGQLTPENRYWRIGKRKETKCFNEAGAINPGKRAEIDAQELDFPSFNEAGAINPGKRQRSPLFGEPQSASMRPGQLTPENSTGVCRGCGGWAGFNEAGAINPGKRGPSWSRRDRGHCFNEAGAINPGKRRAPPAGWRSRRSFNEAGAINPGKRSISDRRRRGRGPLQ